MVITFTSFAALQQRRLDAAATKGEAARGALTTAESLCVGIASALIGGLCTQPIDVVKTRMMTQAAAAGVAPYADALDCVRTMLAHEGPAAFFAGLMQRSLYMGPLWAIQFAINERLKAAMLERNQCGHASPP